MTHHRLIRRGGYSLIELIAVMTVMAMLMALAAGLIKLMLKLDQSSRDAGLVAADSARLARTARSDAHRSVGPVEAGPAGDRVAWTLPDGERVAYLARPADILREVRREGHPPRRETFRLPPAAAAHFEARPEAGRPFLAITIRRSASPKFPAISERIDAEFGRLTRLVRGEP